MDSEIWLCKAKQSHGPHRQNSTPSFAANAKGHLLRSDRCTRHLSLQFRSSAENPVINVPYCEFRGKYVFGVPLAEASGADSLLLDSSDFTAPSFESASLGSWDTGWRSQAPKPRDTIAIRVKNFFIEFPISTATWKNGRLEGWKLEGMEGPDQKAC